MVPINGASAVHRTRWQWRSSSRLVFILSSALVFVGIRLIGKFGNCRIISLFVIRSAGSIVVLLAVVALLMRRFVTSIARRTLEELENEAELSLMSLSHLYLLLSTFGALQLVSHIWILPDAVNHECALFMRFSNWEGILARLLRRRSALDIIARSKGT